MARAFVTASASTVIGAGRAVVPNLGLVCSELVTNAVQAGSAEVVVDLDVHRSRLDIAVRDTAPGMPQVRQPTPDAEHGRGLRVVAALSRQVAIDGRSGGKTVTAQLQFEPPLDDTFQCVD